MKSKIFENLNLDAGQRAKAEKSVKAIIHALSTFKRSPEGHITAAQELIADRAGLSRKTVSKWMPKILGTGIIKIVTKNCAYPLPDGTYKLFATVYEFCDYRGYKHSHIHNNTTKSNKSNNNSSNNSNNSNNLSKLHFDGRTSLGSNNIINTEIDEENLKAEDFVSLFDLSNNKWKKWRAEQRKKRAAETAELRKSILAAVSAQDDYYPRVHQDHLPLTTYNVVQPLNRPRCACGSLLRLTVCRKIGLNYGVYFYHCPACKQTHDFRAVCYSEVDEVVPNKEFYQRELEREKLEQEKREKRERQELIEYNRIHDALRLKNEQRRQKKLDKERQARAEKRQEKRKAQNLKQKQEIDKQKEYFRQIAAGEIKVDFAVDPRALAAALT